jgi:hypothetical protein
VTDVANHFKALKRLSVNGPLTDRNVLTFSRHFNLLSFKGQRTEVIFKPLSINAVKFLPPVNG